MAFESDAVGRPIVCDGLERMGPAARRLGAFTFEGAVGIVESGPHGYLEGQRIRVHGLVKKPQFNGLLGTVESLLDPFGMGRLAVQLDTSQELSLKAANLELVCQLCSAVSSDQRPLILCQTCEAIHICASCKPAHACRDQNGKIGVTLGIGTHGRLGFLDVAPGSPAADAGFLADDVLLAVDGIAVTGAEYPEMAGPVGSDVTIRVERVCPTHGASEFQATVRRGRRPKYEDALLNTQAACMPGVKVLALLFQDSQTCTYKVEIADRGDGNIGLLKYDLATGGGRILLPCAPDVGEALGECLSSLSLC